MASLPARVKRKFTSSAPDTPDPTKIGSAKWNDDLDVFLGTVCEALAQLDLAADKLAYFDGSASAKLTSLTAFARLLLASDDNAQARDLLAAVGKAGDTMSGPLAMGNNKISGLAAPTAANDAARKADVDAVIAAASGALIFKAGFDASAGSFAAIAAGAKKGWFWKVDNAGTVNGITFTVGDTLFALVDSPSSSTYAGNWLKVEGTMTSAEIVVALGFTPENAAKKNAANGYIGADSAGRIAKGQMLRTLVEGQSQDLTDCNDAIEAGFYRAANTAANRPPTITNSTCLLRVNHYNPTYIEQIAYDLSANPAVTADYWRRVLTSGTWRAWQRVRITETDLDARYIQQLPGFLPLGGVGANDVGIAQVGSDGILRARNGTNTNQAHFMGNALLSSGGYFNLSGTVGASGFGFRSNAGVAEARDNGGTWSPVLTATDIGIDVGDVVVVQPGGKLPALDASDLLNLPGATGLGDIIHVHKNGTDQTLNNGDNVKVTFGTETVDEGGRWDAANSRFIPGNNERWLIGGNIKTGVNLADGAQVSMHIRKNGTLWKEGPVTNNGAALPIAMVVPCLAIVGNGSDYYEIYIQLTNNGAAVSSVSGAETDTYFTATRLR